MKKISILVMLMWYLLAADTTFAFTRGDTLRGSNGPARSWWNVTSYTLNVALDTVSKRIRGTNSIRLRVTAEPCDSLQIDLQEPLQITHISLLPKIHPYNPSTINAKEEKVRFTREGNVYWVKYPFHNWVVGEESELLISYEGEPRKAVNPPWDGGFCWERDSLGKPWVAVSCQGLGASVWWPCKDAQWDEPDNGMLLAFRWAGERGMASNTPPLTIVTNGKLQPRGNYSIVTNPINSYNVTFYAGDYVHWHDTMLGEMGILDLDYWVLSYNEQRARKHFNMVKQMLHCFEYWMGPYPFYADGYKLVEAPYLGMEHQSAIAYGNNYKMGYKGYDRSGTGIGMNFDYIIVHETGHEWFGNSITAKDIADNWIHEGITTYSESLYEECLTNKDNGEAFCVGEWSNIRNDKPLIGTYGVNEEGSNDIYDKGAAIMHMIRVMTNNDVKFRNMLRGLSQKFYHCTVTTPEIEQYIATNTGLELSAFFNQYLRETSLPELEYYLKDKILYYRFRNVVVGFSLPIIAGIGKRRVPLTVNGKWQEVRWKGGYNISFSKNLLYTIAK